MTGFLTIFFAGIGVFTNDSSSESSSESSELSESSEESESDDESELESTTFLGYSVLTYLVLETTDFFIILQ